METSDIEEIEALIEVADERAQSIWALDKTYQSMFSYMKAIAKSNLLILREMSNK